MKQLFLFIITSCLIFTGCLTTDNNGNPTQVLQEFADAIVKKDMLRAKQLSTPESQSVLNMMSVAGITTGVRITDKFDKNKVEFGTAIINGDNATVPITDRASRQTIQFPLRKINGQWRVSVDAGSMMGMAKNKVNTTTGSWRDSAKNVLKRINTEGIKKKINNMLDSIKIDIP